MEESIDEKILVYKCPYVKCKAFYYKFVFLINHLSNVYHDFEENLYEIKCPIENCNLLIDNRKLSTVSNNHISLSILKDHCKSVHKKNVKKTLAVSKDIYSTQTIENYIKAKYKPREIFNKTDNVLLRSVNLFDLLYSDSEIGRILKNKLTENCLLIQDKNMYKCQIWGCYKEYDSKLLYRAHINTHKHSMSNLIYHANKNFKIDFEKLLIELRFFDTSFKVEKIPHVLENEKDFFWSILFKNDFNQSTKTPAKAQCRAEPDLRDNKLLEEYKWETFKLAYDSIDEMSSIEGIIENVWYKGSEYKIEKSKIFPNYEYLNLKECITFAVMTINPNPVIVIGTKKNFEFDYFGKFDSNSSKIYILDENFNLIEKIEFNCGYPRKVLLEDEKNHEIIYVLFSDGIIRKLEFKNNFFDFKPLDCGNIIDFEIVDNKTIVCTDGQVVYKLVEGKMVAKTEYFDSVINSLCIRTRIRDGFPLHNDTNQKLDCDEMLSDIKQKTSRNFIYFSTVNGNIYSVDENLDNKLSLLKNYYTNNLIYIERDDEIVITNHMYEKTRLLIVCETFAKTRGLVDSIIYSLHRTNTGYLFGLNDGSVKFLRKCKSKRGLETLFKFVQKGNILFILDTINEREYVKEKKFECLVKKVCQHNKSIFVFLKCGIIFKFLLNKI
ncbi:WD40 repeat domain-containing protein [Vairimorpha necatrix]|uniref:WD40 repeat domain-containing protein n=1 Tax=Vairimorpha necatrix TaxID=6039 RepID=A0AAX4J8V9_9MICR